MRGRGVLRSANTPTGDLAEYLFCKAFGWSQESNSVKAFNAKDDEGTRFQIKGRRIHCRNKSRQLSAIRDLEGFDILAAILFDDDYRIMRAALIPASVVKDHSTKIEHTNSYRFMLRDARDDLDEIWRAIAQDNPDTADRVENKILELLYTLAEHPLMGRKREDLTPRDVRFWPIYSYLVIYDANTKPVSIVRILSGYRDLTALL